MKSKICLNMIVKNESAVIQRCLQSVKKFIDYWVIVDTGSTDGTQEIVKNFLKDIPGELHERPWVDFSQNRNEALTLAQDKADYILFIDADDKLVYTGDFVLPILDQDFYHVVQNREKTRQQALLLAKNATALKWTGPVREAPILTSKKQGLLSGLFLQCMQDGSRSQDPERFKNDVRELKQALRGDPTNARNVFYLAQSYLDAKEYQSALKYYEKRAGMEGDKEEKFYALYSIGLIQRRLKENSDTFVKSLSKAYRFRTSRVEPIYALADYFIETENYLLGYLVTRCAISTPAPMELNVEPWMYEWGVLSQFYLCALKIGKKDQALDAYQKLLAIPQLPAEKRAEIEKLQLQAKSL